MGLSLIKEIIRSLRHTDKESTITDGRSGFYIPSGRTLQAVEFKRELCLWEINDYMNYILKNYYMNDLEYEDLLNFTAEWTKYGKDAQEIELRTRRATSNLVNCLSTATPISNRDILWASNRVYVEDSEPQLRRVIIKRLNSNELDFDVITQQQDPQVGNEMDWLATILNHKKHSQGVDKNL